MNRHMYVLISAQKRNPQYENTRNTKTFLPPHTINTFLSSEQPINLNGNKIFVNYKIRTDDIKLHL